MSLTPPQRINIASYGGNNGNVSTSTVGTGTTAGNVVSNLYLWSDATNTKRIEIYRIVATMGGGSTNWFSIRGAKITAVNGTPGGTTITAAPFDRDDPVSSLTSTTGAIVSGATGAPTRAANDMFIEVAGASNTGQEIILFDYTKAGKAITLRASTGEGFEVRTVVGASNLTTASQVAVTMFWTEV